MSGYSSYINSKNIYLNVSLFHFPMNFSMVPDAMNLFNKFLTIYCVFEEIGD